MSLTVQTQPFLDLLSDVALFSGDTRHTNGVHLSTGTELVDGEPTHVLVAVAYSDSMAARGWVQAGGDIPDCFLRMADAVSLRDLWSKRSKTGKEDPPHGLHLAEFQGDRGMELVASPDAILFDEGAPTLRVPTDDGLDFPIYRALEATDPGVTSRTDIPEVGAWDYQFISRLGRVCSARNVTRPEMSQPRGRLVACVGEQLRVSLHAIYDVPRRKNLRLAEVA